MRRKNLPLFYSFIILLFVFICCDRSTEPENDSDELQVSNVEFSDCLPNEPKKSEMEECFECTVINGNYLKVKRTNVCFNCCYDNLMITVTLVDTSKILITERENAALCQCNCLYNVEYIVGPFEYKEYELTVDVQYWQTDMKFDLVFNDNTNEKYCEERIGYPWDL